MEINAFIVLCFTGVLIIIQSDGILSMAVPMNIITLSYFVVSLINDRVQAKLESVYIELYNLPWYTFRVDEQKLLLIVMQCNFIKMRLSAARLHEISLNQFSNVIQYAYSNILILKKVLALQN